MYIMLSLRAFRSEIDPIAPLSDNSLSSGRQKPVDRLFLGAF